MVSWPTGMGLKAGTQLLEMLEHLTQAAFLPLVCVCSCNRANVSFDNKKHQKVYIDWVPPEVPAEMQL